MMAFTTNASVSLSGKVINDSTNKPMESVKVVLMTLSDSTIISETVSDKNGDFRIDNVHEGRYRLTISYSGFNETGLILLVKADSMTFPDFRLKASDKVSEIVVPMRILQMDWGGMAAYMPMPTTRYNTVDTVLKNHGRYL